MLGWREAIDSERSEGVHTSTAVWTYRSNMQPHDMTTTTYVYVTGNVAVGTAAALEYTRYYTEKTHNGREYNHRLISHQNIKRHFFFRLQLNAQYNNVPGDKQRTF